MCFSWRASITLILLGTQAASGEEKHPTIRLHIENDKYIVNEPIGICVTIRNETTKELCVPIDFPSMFYEVCTGKLLLTCDDGQITKREQFARPNILDYKIPVVTIPPNKKWENVFYLQRFFNKPKPGKHAISYRVKLSGTLDDVVLCNLTAAGKLRFSVEDVNEQKQLAMFAAIAKRAIETQNDTERFGALYSLSTIDEPLVLGQLAQLIDKMPHEHGMQSIYQSLKRFSQQKSTIRVASDGLEGKGGALSISEALTLVTHWRLSVPKDLVEKIRRQGDGEIDRKLEIYLKALKEELKKTQ